MTKLILLTMTLATVCLSNSKVFAQKMQNEVVISSGVGFSLGMRLLKDFINLSLKNNGFDNSVFTPPINLQVDYAIIDNFSIGGAYTFNKFSASGSRTVLDTTIVAKVALTRTNIGIRPLFHFGDDETLDIFFGGRLGYSIWNGEYEVVDNFGNDYSDSRINNRSATIFSAQILFGIRKYFNDLIGVNFEAGLGTAPYLIAGGISFKL